jgi:RNase P protein component
LDFVVNVKPNAADAEYRDFSRDLERVLQRASAESARTRRPD